MRQQPLLPGLRTGAAPKLGQCFLLTDKGGGEEERTFLLINSAKCIKVGCVGECAVSRQGIHRL